MITAYHLLFIPVTIGLSVLVAARCGRDAGADLGGGPPSRPGRAHLDATTAGALATELLAATGGRTALIVTHRPGQIPNLPHRLGTGVARHHEERPCPIVRSA